jgi:hypothetical protein
MRRFRDWLRWRWQLNESPELQKYWNLVRHHPEFKKVATRRWQILDFEIISVPKLVADLGLEHKEVPALCAIAKSIEGLNRCCVITIQNEDRRGLEYLPPSHGGKMGTFYIDADLLVVRHVSIGHYVT